MVNDGCNGDGWWFLADHFDSHDISWYLGTPNLPQLPAQFNCARNGQKCSFIVFVFWQKASLHIWWLNLYPHVLMANPPEFKAFWKMIPSGFPVACRRPAIRADLAAAPGWCPLRRAAPWPRSKCGDIRGIPRFSEGKCCRKMWMFLDYRQRKYVAEKYEWARIQVREERMLPRKCHVFAIPSRYIKIKIIQNR